MQLCLVSFLPIRKTRYNFVTVVIFFQALYFSYGFGAFVSPLIAEPFLSGTPHPDIGLPAAKRGNPLPYGGMGHRGHHHLSHRPTNHMRDTFYTEPEKYKSEVQVAYWIIALAHVSYQVLEIKCPTVSPKWQKGFLVSNVYR